MVPTFPIRAGLAVCALVMLAGCASTTVTINPTPQAPVCTSASPALVLWAPRWRADQKDVPSREQAAETGLRSFLGASGCFARTELRRVASLDSLTPSAAPMDAQDDPNYMVIGVEVRELGPVVRLFSSAALVEGGTEVVLRIAVLQPNAARREFTVHWQNGGAGQIKGVSTLPQDMELALRAAL